MRRLGLHTSIAGGIHNSLERAKVLGCSAIQIFSHNPRGWHVRARDGEECRRFIELRAAYDIAPVFIHASYLINPASRDRGLLEKSIAMTVEEMNIADSIGAEFVVLHTGSASGDDPAAARKRVSDCLRRVRDSGRWRARLLLENTAGEKGDIATRISEISEIMDDVGGDLISGTCFDTCHGFAAGYDLRTSEGVERISSEIEKYIGKERLKLIHLNDSKGGPGSGVDRHQHIGEGNIGTEAICNFLQHPLFNDIPLILETPKKTDQDDARNLATVKALLKKLPPK